MQLFQPEDLLLSCVIAAVYELHLAVLVPKWRAWLRRREEPRDEWVLSLDGKDLAILDKRQRIDASWSGFRVRPFTPEDVNLLTERELWDRGRFRFRHKVSGRPVPDARASTHVQGTPVQDDLRVSMLGLD